MLIDKQYSLLGRWLHSFFLRRCVILNDLDVCDTGSVLQLQTVYLYAKHWTNSRMRLCPAWNYGTMNCLVWIKSIEKQMNKIAIKQNQAPIPVCTLFWNALPLLPITGSTVDINLCFVQPNRSFASYSSDNVQIVLKINHIHTCNSKDTSMSCES